VARAVKTVQVDTVRDRTRNPRDASIAAIEARLPAASKPADVAWWATLADGTIVNVVGGVWTAQSTGAVTGPVVNVSAGLAAAAMPATIAALEALYPAASKPAGLVWEGNYGTAGDEATARVVDGVWVPVDVPTAGTVRNVTPLPIPADLAALEAAVPAAGRPATEAWFALTGAGPTYRTAAVVGANWRYVDGLGAAAYVGATALLAATAGIPPAAPAGAQGLVWHGDGLWRMPIPNWTANTDYSEGEPVFQNRTIYRRRAPGGKSGLTFNAAELATWEALADLSGRPATHLTRTTVAAAVPAAPTLAELQAAVTAAGLTDGFAYYTGTDVASDPATHAVAVDANGRAFFIERPASGGLVRETLTVVSRDTINPLTQTPTSPVEFSVNGQIVPAGISNTGTAITVTPATVGFHIDPGVDVVQAQYAA